MTLSIERKILRHNNEIGLRSPVIQEKKKQLKSARTSTVARDFSILTLLFLWSKKKTASKFARRGVVSHVPQGVTGGTPI